MPESKRFLLRLNPRLFEAIRRWADEDLRSINAQIEYLLTDQARRAGRLPRGGGTPPPPDPAAPEDDTAAEGNRGTIEAGAAAREELSGR